MRIGLPNAFLLLMCSQAAHSLEEYLGALWEVLAPARAISGLFSDDLAVGFAVANTLIVVLGFACYLGPIRLGWRSAEIVAWSWVLLEVGNSIGHTLFAVGAGGYFPGTYTTPLLFVFACLVGYQLLNSKHEKAAP